jgi:hypothetical protein
MKWYAACLTATLIAATVLEPAIAGSDIAYDPSFDCHEGPYRLRLPKTYQELKRIGSLRSESVLETQKYVGEKSTLTALDFGSLYISVRIGSSAPDKFLVSIVESSDPRWQVTGPFRVGESFKSVLKKLHQKGALAPDKWEYGGDGGSVRFEVSAGKVTKVTYQCYSG